MTNARFWVYVNGGPVKVTLKPGQRLAWGRAQTTDEGFWSVATYWELVDGVVRREWREDGRDCDGRLIHDGADMCPVSRLRDGFSPIDSIDHQYLDGSLSTWEGVVYPAWDRVSAYQYDEYAESAGY